MIKLILCLGIAYAMIEVGEVAFFTVAIAGLLFGAWDCFDTQKKLTRKGG